MKNQLPGWAAFSAAAVVGFAQESFSRRATAGEYARAVRVRVLRLK